jgi:hypothetical protein
MKLKRSRVMANTKKTFLRYWAFVSVLLCGGIALHWNGTFNDIYEADVTGISNGIYVVFGLAIILTGFASMRVANANNQFGYASRTDKYVDISWFLSEAMMTLGLIGTVAGMIYLFGQIFHDIDPSDPDDLKAALSHMASGLSTAMYTTIVGMVGALCTKVLLMNIEFDQGK